MRCSLLIGQAGMLMLNDLCRIDMFLVSMRLAPRCLKLIPEHFYRQERVNQYILHKYQLLEEEFR
jgi:hypothetical protein